MNLQLEHKRALITGSTSGIGFAIAKLLATEGAEVILNGRTEAGVEMATVRLLQALPAAKVSGLAADFHHADTVQRLAENTGEVDILINNVGIFKSQQFEYTADADWLEMFEVNVMSGVRLSRALLPKMRINNWGRIIFISSECAGLVPEDLIAYSATKAAVQAVSRGLAQTTRGTGITVNAVLPGSTLSEGAKNFLKSAAKQQGTTEQAVAESFFKEVRSTSLLGRFASTEEVASMVTYLCSPLAAATNGAAMKVDGGSVSGIF